MQFINPNFIPWLPFFAKMYQADKFILMVNCQFEKNGYQNRCKVNDKWWTKPVNSGNSLIKDKTYTDGQKLYTLNTQWIFAIARTLGIDTDKIHVDFPTEKKGTERIVELCKRFECNQYLTNPEATEKYLNESEMVKYGIEIVPFEFPYKIHVFEAFDKFGIEGTIKLIRKQTCVV